jgi:nitrogen fixation protein NifQ
MREQECQELEQWLTGYQQPDAAPMARIIAVASMGFNHLWQDLGLASRQSLRELMQCCFPELVAMNSQNMRWKKFFYRQQCALGGNYVCRAPSCDECVERASCFAPET